MSTGATGAGSQPGAVHQVLDSQSTTAIEAGGERGYDGGGEKRSTGANGNAGLIRTDSWCACSCIRRIYSDAEGAEWLLAAHHDCFPRLKDMRVDEGDASSLDTWLQQHTAMRLNVVEKPIRHEGVAVIPQRWVIERSIAWAGRNRWERRIIIRRNNRNPNRLYPRCSFLITLSYEAKTDWTKFGCAQTQVWFGVKIPLTITRY